MPRSENQKLKLLYIMKILLENTDEQHGITVNELIAMLAGYDIAAERKSIYTDFEDLRRFGLDIIMDKRDRKNVYYIGSREFEMAELKLLVDSVQSARFLTEKKAGSLIKKLERLASRYEAVKLHRQVYVQDRIRTMNESIYYNIDVIHDAIASNVKITFRYYEWDINKNMNYRKDGTGYLISPWALIQNAENYYLVGYDSEAGIIKHYRVDKMDRLDLAGETREGKEVFGEIDMSSYSDRRFGMFAGRECHVKLEFENRYAGVVIDRFGKEVHMRKGDDEHFIINVHVAVSNQFFGWIIALGTGVRVLGPGDVVEELKRMLEAIRNIYC